MSAVVLDFSGVRFGYDGANVLDGIDLSVKRGTMVALMGPSGCGKSTSIAIAAGLIDQAAGTVQRASGRTGVMFQDPLLLPWRTARDNVGFALKPDGLKRKDRRERAQALLQSVGLVGDDIGKYPRQLSGGMRRRVALARALVITPDLLLLDEPFSGLDVALSREMLALVRSRVDTEGLSALVVTHDVREAARFAERVYVMSPVPARIVAVRDFGKAAGQRSESDVEAGARAILDDLAAVSGGGL